MEANCGEPQEELNQGFGFVGGLSVNNKKDEAAELQEELNEDLECVVVVSMDTYESGGGKVFTPSGGPLEALEQSEDSDTVVDIMGSDDEVHPPTAVPSPPASSSSSAAVAPPSPPSSSSAAATTPLADDDDDDASSEAIDLVSPSNQVGRHSFSFLFSFL